MTPYRDAADLTSRPLCFYGSCHQLPQDRNIASDPTTRLLDLVDRLGLVRARNAATAGIPTVYLTRLVRAGALERVARGLYAGASPPVGLAVVRMHPRALAAGVVVHEVGGTPVPVFDPSKTIADLFKFRSRVGLDVALEALRAYAGSAHRGDVETLAAHRLTAAQHVRLLTSTSAYLAFVRYWNDKVREAAANT